MSRLFRPGQLPGGLSLFNALLVSCAPLFVLAVPRWSNAILFCGATLAVLLLWRDRHSEMGLPPRDRNWVRAFIAAMVLPLLAVGLSALLRQDPYPATFDAPSRFLLAVPIFLFVLHARVDPSRVLRWVLPAALLAALLSMVLFGRADRYPLGRETNTMVDPLVFGYLSLTFGLMCLVSITPRQWQERRWIGILWRLFGLGLGIYLSLGSGSRTGWVAVPVVVGAWLYLHWGRGHPVRSLAVVVAALALPVLAYLLVPTVHARANETWAEIAGYDWQGVAPFTSVGLRITFLRIAADSFVLHPWAGLGDTSRLPTETLPAFRYASPEAVEAAFHAAFHNQVVTNAVRYGVGGLLSCIALLLVPLAICARQLRRGSEANRQNAIMGFAYMVCIVISSVSTEVVDLKYLASFYAVMTAILCGGALAQREAVAGPGS